MPEYLDESSTGGTGEEKQDSLPNLTIQPTPLRGKKSAGPPSTKSIATAAVVLHQQKSKGGSKPSVEKIDTLSKKPLIPKASM